MDNHYAITRDQLIDGLRQWDEDAKKGAWPDRDDPTKFADNADYLLKLMGF